jgi:hypothetical protein
VNDGVIGLTASYSRSIAPFWLICAPLRRMRAIAAEKALESNTGSPLTRI